MSSIADDELLIDRRGAIVRVLLNRPRALNALTHAMCQALLQGLDDWQHDPEVRAVVIEGQGERAFCAGGDIRRVADLVDREGVDSAAGFFRTEYALNARLFHFTKPWIALLDGIVMGGGVGISLHGRYRVATERTVFAMPETGIGFFPDVGATWVLPRLPGASGSYLGLTGRRLKAGDCLALGLATHVVERAALSTLTDGLAALAPSDGFDQNLRGLLDELAIEVGPDELGSAWERIDACFSRPSLSAVIQALRQESGAWAKEALDALAGKAPMSLAVTFEQLRRGAELQTFDQAMRLEYRLVHHFLAGHDFREGVRALIVDKDNAPAWRPARPEEVDPEEVERYFAPPPSGDLDLPATEERP